MNRSISLATPIFAALSVALMISGVAFAEAPQNYRIVELPTLESPPECSPNSNAIAINEKGQAVGVAESASAACSYKGHAVIWKDGETVDLGGIPPHTDWGGSAKGINDTGDAVVGWAPIELAGGGGTGGAFIWTEADGMSLIDDGNSFPYGQAWGVNNSYEVAVTYRDKAYYWTSTEGLRPIEFTDTPDSNSASWEINNSGVVVGYSRRISAGNLLHAFKYDSATSTITDLHDADWDTYDQSGAYGINDDGDVVGFIEAPDGEYASVWLNGQSRIDLPIQVFGPGYVLNHAEHINAHHDVVGIDKSGAGGEPAIAWVAFEVSAGNTDRVALTDLLSVEDAAAWELSSAFEINDSRQIVGIGLHNGSTRGFLMTPFLFEDGFESGTTDAWSVVQP